MHEVTYFEIRQARQLAEGSIEVPIHKWAGRSHRSDQIKIKPTDIDYAFWYWLTRPWRMRPLTIDRDVLERLRQRYERQAPALAGRDAAPPNRMSCLHGPDDRHADRTTRRRGGWFGLRR